MDRDREGLADARRADVHEMGHQVAPLHLEDAAGEGQEIDLRHRVGPPNPCFGNSISYNSSGFSCSSTFFACRVNSATSSVCSSSVSASLGA
jgi:hypothetical protein